MVIDSDTSLAKVTVVIVTYQSSDTIANTMDALQRAHETGKLQCIVVDNNSSDATAEILNGYASWAQVILGPENIGFARGCNIGLDKAKTDYVLFLNPDAIIEPEAISQLVNFMQANSNVGLIAPAIIEPDGDVQGVGNLSSPWTILATAAPLIESPQFRPVNPGENPFKTDWLCGAVLMGRTQLLKRLNGFDSRFFLYFDETDLCRRVLDTGAEIWSYGKAVAHHTGAVSTGTLNDQKFKDCIAEHFFQSRYYYLQKHHGNILAAFTEISEVFLLGIRNILSIILFRKRSGMFEERLRGPILQSPPVVEK